jgi:hypothetical protein
LCTASRSAEWSDSRRTLFLSSLSIQLSECTPLALSLYTSLSLLLFLPLSQCCVCVRLCVWDWEGSSLSTSIKKVTFPQYDWSPQEAKPMDYESHQPESAGV